MHTHGPLTVDHIPLSAIERGVLRVAVERCFLEALAAMAEDFAEQPASMMREAHATVLTVTFLEVLDRPGMLAVVQGEITCTPEGGAALEVQMRMELDAFFTRENAAEDAEFSRDIHAYARHPGHPSGLSFLATVKKFFFP